jgi:hypothetical protein
MNGEFYVEVNYGVPVDISVTSISIVWGKRADGFPIEPTAYAGMSVTDVPALLFDNCDLWDSNEHAIGYALYLVEVTYGGNTHYVYVDWRDCDYPTKTNYTTRDLSLFFDVYTNTWKANNTIINNGSTLCIWSATAGMKSVNTQNTSGFTPTDPTDLTLTNYNNFPKLDWVGSEPGSANYIVYRVTTQISDTISSNSYIDYDYEIMQSGGTITYKVRAVSGDGSRYSENYTNTVSTKAICLLKPAETGEDSHPQHSGVVGTYPNPFNPQTSIRFVLTEDTHVSLAIYDMLGRQVLQLVDQDFKAGTHEAIWNGVDARGSTVPSGTYIYSLRRSDGLDQGTMLLLKLPRSAAPELRQT